MFSLMYYSCACVMLVGSSCKINSSLFCSVYDYWELNLGI
uniref:Uncharacterized protein n=1 Tax=Arundo donax TaxID=35708 RepID=A0A0A9F8B3_ARUDO